MRRQQTVAEVAATRHPCGGGCGGLIEVGATRGTNCSACRNRVTQQAETLVVTDAMRRAVRTEQCAFDGHSLDTIVEGMTGVPVLVVCSHCERSWAVKQ